MTLHNSPSSPSSPNLIRAIPCCSVYTLHIASPRSTIYSFESCEFKRTKVHGMCEQTIFRQAISPLNSICDSIEEPGVPIRLTLVQLYALRVSLIISFRQLFLSPNQNLFQGTLRQTIESISLDAQAHACPTHSHTSHGHAKNCKPKSDFSESFFFLLHDSSRQASHSFV